MALALEPADPACLTRLRRREELCAAPEGGPWEGVAADAVPKFASASAAGRRQAAGDSGNGGRRVLMNLDRSGETEAGQTAAARIVVVDDDPLCLESVSAYLEEGGFLVRRASRGEEALAALAPEAADLFLLDLQLPGVHGLDVLAAIRERSPATPVIVFSGEASVADVVRALRLGASDYLLKPVIDLEILDHAVRGALERARLLREREEYQHRLERAIRARTRELQDQLAQRLSAEAQLR